MKSLPFEGTVGALPETEPFVLFARPDIGPREIEAVAEVLRSGWITTGAEVRRFEREFADYVGTTHAVAVNSCTAALHLGLEALGVRAGDEVVTSSLTFTATAEVMVYLGARPRFADVDPDTLNLSVDDLRERLLREYLRRDGEWRHRQTGARLGGILPVHYGGHPCDMPALLSLAADAGLPLLDDAAHALPAAISGRRIGSFPCPTAFSFYATKPITTGEGGMLCTDDPALAQRARMMSLHGISRDAWNRYAAHGSWDYEVVEAGFKYNLTDIAGALGRVQLTRCDEMLAARQAIAARYQEAFAGLEAVERPVCRPGVQHAWHLYPIRLHLDALRIDRARFIEELRDRGIGASVHFIPLHQQPFYAERYGYQTGDLPQAAAAYPRLVSLPIYSGMAARDVESVIAAVWDIADTFHA